MPENYFEKEALRKISRLEGRGLKCLIGGFLILLFLVPQLSQAQDGVTPGKFIIEPPTLKNLGFEWYIDGDDNRNATVEVEYRIAGSGNEWSKGMPAP